MRRRQLGFVQILTVVLAVLAAVDLVVGTFKFARSMRRQKVADAFGALSTESPPAYFRRLWRGVAPYLLLLAVLVLGFLAILRFGPLKPIHEWFP